MSFLSSLLGIGSIVSPLLGMFLGGGGSDGESSNMGSSIGAGLGAASQFLASSNAQEQANNASQAQKRYADQQSQLYSQTSPMYTQLLGQLQSNANQAATPESYLGQPAQQMALNGMNGSIGHQYQSSADQLGFGLGRRGLTGSNVDVAGRAALLANADQQRANFQRQLIMQQPGEYERRLGLLGNALNPGLGAGGVAANIYGQQAAQGYNQANQYGSNLGSSLQNFMMYDALRRAQIGMPNPMASTGSYQAGPGGVPYSPNGFQATYFPGDF